MPHAFCITARCSAFIDDAIDADPSSLLALLLVSSTLPRVLSSCVRAPAVSVGCSGALWLAALIGMLWLTVSAAARAGANDPTCDDALASRARCLVAPSLALALGSVVPYAAREVSWDGTLRSRYGSRQSIALIALAMVAWHAAALARARLSHGACDGSRILLTVRNTSALTRLSPSELAAFPPPSFDGCGGPYRTCRFDHVCFSRRDGVLLPNTSSAPNTATAAAAAPAAGILARYHRGGGIATPTKARILPAETLRGARRAYLVHGVTFAANCWRTIHSVRAPWGRHPNP